MSGATGATDTDFVDIVPLLQSHDRKTRRTYIAMLSVSLGLSAIIFAHASLTTGAAPGRILEDLWAPVLMAPLTICFLWIGSAAYGRNRPTPLPDGTVPMNVDDAGNVARVANAGGVFVTGMCTLMIVAQFVWLMAALGVLQLPETAPGWGIRAILLGTGALSVYFGNAWPRIPTPRAPDQHPAAHIRYQRLGGWLTVIFGLAVAIAAFLPFSAMTPVLVAAGVFIIGGSLAAYASFRLALNSGSAS